MPLSLSYNHPEENLTIKLLCEIALSQDLVLNLSDAESLARTLLFYHDEIKALPRTQKIALYETSVFMVASYPGELQILEVVQEAVAEKIKT